MSGGLYLGSVTVNNELASLALGVDANGNTHSIGTALVGTQYYLNTYRTTTASLAKTGGYMVGSNTGPGQIPSGFFSSPGDVQINMADYKRITVFGNVYQATDPFGINIYYSFDGVSNSWYESSLGPINIPSSQSATVYTFSRDFETTCPYISIYTTQTILQDVSHPDAGSGTICYGLSA